MPMEALSDLMAVLSGSVGIVATERAGGQVRN